MTSPDLVAEIEAERRRVKRKAYPPKPESAEHRERRRAIGRWKGTAGIIWVLYLHYLTDEELLWFVPRQRDGLVKPTADDAIKLQTLYAAVGQRQTEEKERQRAAVEERLRHLGLPVGRRWS
jgi:hypothetical protein